MSSKQPKKMQIPAGRCTQRPTRIVLPTAQDEQAPTPQVTSSRNWNINIDVKPHWIITALAGLIGSLHHAGII
jgi:hypothetical protein